MADAAGVLDALGVARAHVVGMSMGGALAQLLALRAPARLITLTLMSTSGGPGDPDLPMGSVEPVPDPDWSSRASVLDYQVASQRTVASRTRPFDDAAVRAVASAAFDRTASPESADKNHHAAEGDGESWRSRLPEITVPTLVLHGTEDPMFPLAHGAALAREVAHGRLVPLPHTGHEFPRENWPLVLRELVAHIG